MNFSKSFKYLKRRINFLSIIFIALLLSVSYYGCNKNDYSPNSSNNPAPAPSANEIFIQGMSFVSGDKTISVGTTLKWTNQDNVAHTVTSGVPGSPSGVFDSGNINYLGSFSYTFNQAGVYKYYCKIHTSMTGTITVQ